MLRTTGKARLPPLYNYLKFSLHLPQYPMPIQVPKWSSVSGLCLSGSHHSRRMTVGRSAYLWVARILPYCTTRWN